MADSRNHVIGSLHDFLRSVKTSGFSDVRVGPLTDSNSKRLVSRDELEAAVMALSGMTVTLRMAGSSLELVDPDGNVVATLSTTV